MSNISFKIYIANIYMHLNVQCNKLTQKRICLYVIIWSMGIDRLRFIVHIQQMSFSWYRAISFHCIMMGMT